MKNLVILTSLLWTVNFSTEHKNILPFNNPQFVLENVPSTSTRLNTSNSVTPPVPLNISRFLKYLNDNQSFPDVLISFAVNSSNQLYFIALAAKKPEQNGSLAVADRSVEEFSSENRNRSTFPTGSNRDDQRNFVNGIGNSLTIKAYYMSMSDLRSQMEVYANANTRNIDVDIVSTTVDNQTFMDLVFPSTTTSGNLRTLSTFSSGGTLSAPASGCPPFNCEY